MKATGGGAFKFADLFDEKLGVSLEKEEEMECLVAGANFLLKVRFLKTSVQLFPTFWKLIGASVFISYRM